MQGEEAADVAQAPNDQDRRFLAGHVVRLLGESGMGRKVSESRVNGASGEAY